MGSARNMINILAAEIIIVCGMGLGTASEAALAIKQGKPIIFTCVKPDQVAFFEVLCKRTLDRLENPAQIIRKAEKLLRL
jgi:predicted Rossmann-fold nucleotide-binding protein